VPIYEAIATICTISSISKRNSGDGQEGEPGFKNKSSHGKQQCKEKPNLNREDDQDSRRGIQISAGEANI
jgi:hypothetical protein